MAADGRTVLPYLASEPTTETFRSFLQTLAELLRVAPTWTIRIVFPRPLDHAYDAYQAVIHEELESPLHSATIGELQSYFELRLEAARGEPMHPLNQTTPVPARECDPTRAQGVVHVSVPLVGVRVSIWGGGNVSDRGQRGDVCVHATTQILSAQTALRAAHMKRDPVRCVASDRGGFGLRA